MEAEVQGYLTELGILRGQIGDAVRGLNDEAANWRPLSEGTNSIYAILSHLIGVDRYWVWQVICEESVHRDRAAEFQASGRLSEVVSRWGKVATEAESILKKLTLTQLAETRTVPARPEWGAVTVRWCILHLISHHAIHLGHIQLTRQLWDQRLP